MHHGVTRQTNALHKSAISIVHQPVFAVLIVALLIAVVSGCGQYRAPGAAADFRALGISEQTQRERTTPSIARRLDVQPAADFPATVAVVRVQAAGYRSYSTRSYGDGAFSVVTTRDVETQEDFDRIRNLPMIDELAMLNRIVIPSSLQSNDDLRRAAATVHADLLLMYTFDTQFEVESHIKPLGVFTLGLFPDEQARVTATVSAALMDTRTGYVYGLVESTEKTSQLANAWTSESAVDQSRRRVERAAFANLVDQFASLWPAIVQRYAPERRPAMPDRGDAFDVPPLLSGSTGTVQPRAAENPAARDQ